MSDVKLIIAAPIGPPGPTDNADAAAEEARQAAQEARDAAQPLTEQKEAAEAARDAAIEAQGLAEDARDAAEGHAQTASTAAGVAAQARTDAQDAAGEASQSAADAADAAALAGTHRSAAESAAGDAAGSASAAETARTGAETARTQAQGYATTAGEHATQTGLDAAATAADRLAVSQDRQAIETEQAARLAAIEDAGDTQVGRVTAEGTAQVALIEGAGQGRLLPADAPDRSIAQRQGGAWVAIPYPEIVLVNQFAPIAPGMAGWRISNADVSASDGIATVHPTGAPGSVDHHLGSERFFSTEGHLWYCAADVIGTAGSLRFYYTNQDRWTNPTTGEWVRMSLVTDSGLTNRGFGWRDTDLAEFHVSRPVLIDLTATFGAGNEPSVDEMEALLARLAGHFDGTIRIPLIEWVDARTTALSRILQEG